MRTSALDSVDASSTMPNSSPVIEVLQVRKTYPGQPPVESVRGISLTVAAGELTAIVGPSGSGKSTLLHLMAALERPTAGTIRVVGHDTSVLRPKQLAGLRAHHIGVVFQQFHLLDALTARENVALGLVYSGIAPSERRRRACEALQRVGLSHRLTHRPPQLSGGERQRVAIARAVVGTPAVVLADEPTGNLDTATGQEIIGLLQALNRDGTSIVVITHDRSVASAMRRRVAVRDGLVIADDRQWP